MDKRLALRNVVFVVRIHSWQKNRRISGGFPAQMAWPAVFVVGLHQFLHKQPRDRWNEALRSVNLADTWRNNNVMIASKLGFEVIMTLSLRDVSAWNAHMTSI